jgi:hypothetical protein
MNGHLIDNNGIKHLLEEVKERATKQNGTERSSK